MQAAAKAPVCANLSVHWNLTLHNKTAPRGRVLQLLFFIFICSIMRINWKTWISTFLNLTMTIFLKARLKSWRHRQGRNGLKSVCVQDDPSWKVFVALHLLSKIVGEWRKKKDLQGTETQLYFSHPHTLFMYFTCQCRGNISCLSVSPSGHLLCRKAKWRKGSINALTNKCVWNVWWSAVLLALAHSSPQTHTLQMHFLGVAKLTSHWTASVCPSLK